MLFVKKVGLLSPLLLLGLCDEIGADNLRGDRGDGQRSLVDMMEPGQRVADMDRNSAICSAGTDMNPTMPKNETVIDYYYAIESSQNISTSTVEGQALVLELEEAIFMKISPAILWCYYDNVNIGKRDLSVTASSMEDSIHRRMTLEDARRLSIVTFSTSPMDEEETSGNCH
jgi:hypothetical protein